MIVAFRYYLKSISFFLLKYTHKILDFQMKKLLIFKNLSFSSSDTKKADFFTIEEEQLPVFS